MTLVRAPRSSPCATFNAHEIPSESPRYASLRCPMLPYFPLRPPTLPCARIRNEWTIVVPPLRADRASPAAMMKVPHEPWYPRFVFTKCLRSSYAPFPGLAVEAETPKLPHRFFTWLTGGLVDIQQCQRHIPRLMDVHGGGPRSCTGGSWYQECCAYCCSTMSELAHQGPAPPLGTKLAVY